MSAHHVSSRRRRSGLRRIVRAQAGVALIVAIAFVLIFTILGGALYWLVYSQIRSTDTERTDVKSFNVAEAGIDAGMLTLRLNWPNLPSDNATAAVSDAALKAALQAANPGLWDPKLSSPSNFLTVAIYDNVNHTTGQTTDVPDPLAPTWDSNGDGKMFVDATADVGDDRHRILILAEKQQWQLDFPANLALWAGSVDSNGQGFQVSIEDGTPPVYYDVHDALHKGVDPEPPSDVLAATPSTWSNVITTQTQAALMQIAQGEGTYFSGSTAQADATACLTSGNANGKVVYIQSSTAVTITGKTQVGTVAEPVVVVFDTPSGTTNEWNFTGTSDFYGIIITLGNSTLEGTSAMHGAVYCSGMISNKGNGTDAEIYYNQEVIDNVNRQYTIDVNIVPNTWEEYTTPSTSS